MGLSDWTLLDFIQKNLGATNLNGDILEGLIVAANHFVEENNKQKNFAEKRIIVFTDFSCVADDESQLDLILKNLRREEIRIDVISPFSEIEDETDQTNGHGGNRDHQNGDNDATTPKQNRHNNGTASNTHQKEMSLQQRETQRLLFRTCTRTDGSMYSFNEALKVLSVYQAKAVRSAGTK